MARKTSKGGLTAPPHSPAWMENSKKKYGEGTVAAEARKRYAKLAGSGPPPTASPTSSRSTSNTSAGPIGGGFKKKVAKKKTGTRRASAGRKSKMR